MSMAIKFYVKSIHSSMLCARGTGFNPGYGNHLGQQFVTKLYGVGLPLSFANFTDLEFTIEKLE